MLAYSEAMLDAIADFLGSPPIIYLYGLIFLAVVLRLVFRILRKS